METMDNENDIKCCPGIPLRRGAIYIANLIFLEQLIQTIFCLLNRYDFPNSLNIALAIIATSLTIGAGICSYGCAKRKIKIVAFFNYVLFPIFLVPGFAINVYQIHMKNQSKNNCGPAPNQDCGAAQLDFILHVTFFSIFFFIDLYFWSSIWHYLRLLRKNQSKESNPGLPEEAPPAYEAYDLTPVPAQSSQPTPRLANAAKPE
ncbi:uncharacterized protein VTP21DRAFT_481 [Calcarisporiella thermophila]|uniref:uncharacterized protein n=1 Tax=Calcarisporiella thermophila TaxID=911321 RepID=UPI0037445EF2